MNIYNSIPSAIDEAQIVDEPVKVREIRAV
jgi:hypothetical protein